MQHQTSEPEGSISDDDPTDNSESESEFTTNMKYTQNDCLNPPPPGGTTILPEYIHYYGYYYQVIVQC
jgi:hypothetical protein